MLLSYRVRQLFFKSFLRKHQCKTVCCKGGYLKQSSNTRNLATMAAVQKVAESAESTFSPTARNKCNEIRGRIGLVNGEKRTSISRHTAPKSSAPQQTRSGANSSLGPLLNDGNISSLRTRSCSPSSKDTTTRTTKFDPQTLRAVFEHCQNPAPVMVWEGGICTSCTTPPPLLWTKG